MEIGANAVQLCGPLGEREESAFGWKSDVGSVRDVLPWLPTNGRADAHSGGSGGRAVAPGAAQVFLQTLPATASKDSVDALEGPFWIVGLLDGSFIIIVSIPVVAPFVDVAGHII